KSSLRKSSHGRTAIRQNRRKFSESRIMTSLDYHRLGNFRYAIITLVGDDGFPFSVSTDFKIMPDKKIVLQKPAQPSKLDGKRVNVLFNHITGMPGGGYGDRRRSEEHTSELQSPYDLVCRLLLEKKKKKKKLIMLLHQYQNAI